MGFCYEIATNNRFVANNWKILMFYISKWSNEIGYISLSDIGKFNGFIFYPDKNVITKINKELWEKA